MEYFWTIKALGTKNFSEIKIGCKKIETVAKKRWSIKSINEDSNLFSNSQKLEASSSCSDNEIEIDRWLENSAPRRQTFVATSQTE